MKCLISSLNERRKGRVSARVAKQRLPILPARDEAKLNQPVCISE